MKLSTRFRSIKTTAETPKTTKTPAATAIEGFANETVIYAQAFFQNEAACLSTSIVLLIFDHSRCVGTSVSISRSSTENTNADSSSAKASCEAQASHAATCADTQEASASFNSPSNTACLLP